MSYSVASSKNVMGLASWCCELFNDKANKQVTTFTVLTGKRSYSTFTLLILTAT